MKKSARSADMNGAGLVMTILKQHVRHVRTIGGCLNQHANATTQFLSGDHHEQER